MKNCIISLTTPSESQSSPSHHRGLSTQTRVWRCVLASTSASTSMKPLLSDANLQKRQRVEPQVHVRQTEVIQPSESVTVTCASAAPDLGVCGEVEYFVHLHFLIEGLRASHSSCLNKGLLGKHLKQKGGGHLTEDGQDLGSRGLVSEERTKCVFCGTVVVAASTVLQQSEQLSFMMEGLKNSSAVRTGKAFFHTDC